MAKTWVTEDRVAAHGHVYVDSVTLTPDAVGAATVTLKDGLNDDGETVLALSALTSDTKHVSFPNALEFHEGVYVDVGSNVAGVLVVWGRPVFD